MKLIEKVLENITETDIQNLSEKCGITHEQVVNILQSLTPGILSAFKAKIVTNLNDGNANSLINLLSNPSTDSLFSSNHEALNTLIERVSELTSLSQEQISSFLPTALPVVTQAIANMLQSMTGTALFETGSQMLNNFFSSNNQGNAAYENAIDAANQFLNSVFGKNIVTSNNASNLEENNQVFQNILDIFDRNNDGSMMDDIFNMLIKDKL